MNKERALSLLGLSLRAGKLVTGDDLTLREIRKNQAKFVLISSDASENTKKKFMDKCEYYHIPYTLVFSHDEISRAIGKNRMICGLCDIGFSKKIQEIING